MSYDVTINVLRTALDHLEYAIDRCVSPDVWQRCLLAAAGEVELALTVPGPPSQSGQKKRVTLSARPQGGDKPWAVVLQLPGVEITVRKPVPSITPFKCVSVVIHGQLLSRERSHGSLINTVRGGVEKLLFPEAGKKSAERRRALRDVTKVGVFHLAWDVAVGGRHVGVYLSREVFINSHSRLREVWPAPVADDGLRGDVESGQSVRLQQSLSVLSVYEKDKQLQSKYPERWPPFKDVMRACGWNGKSRLIRVEHQQKAEWLADRAFEFADEVVASKSARGLPLAEFLRLLPVIAKTLRRRTFPVEKKKQRIWANRSLLWRKLRKGIKLLELENGTSASIATLVVEQKASSVESLLDRAATIVITLSEIGGGHTLLPTDEVLRRVVTRVNELRSEPSHVLWLRRLRARRGLSPSPQALTPVISDNTTPPSVPEPVDDPATDADLPVKTERD